MGLTNETESVAGESEPGGPVAIGSVPGGAGASPAPRPLIFVSYRIDPDEAVATAMRRLLESSIDPQPEVFVSSAGGLRPSEIGFKPQLQAAVQRASAFVGLITQASKEREWIFYEAGAAWGRGQIYAPVLIDTSPSDLRSSIADYQATRASRADEVQRLVEVLADAVGAQAKSHFSQRYRAFERAIAAYQGRDEDEKEALSPVGEAMRLMEQGKVEEANAAFDALEKAAKSVDERASIRFSKLLAGKETGVDLLEKVEALDDEFKVTAEYLLWKGMLEPKPLTGITNLEASLRVATPRTFVHRTATLTVARRNVEIGREEATLQILASAIRSEDRVLRVDAVARWQELFASLEPTAKLFLLMLGGTGASQSTTLFRQGIELALDQRWPALLARFAAGFDGADGSPMSAHERGRAYHILELPSLAFRAYSKAWKGGITVAKENLASLLRGSAVPAAGLEHLDSHGGSFDGAFAHQIRAGIEESIEAETKRADTLRSLGLKICQHFSLIADLALGDTADRPLREDVIPLLTERFQNAGSKKKLAAVIEGKENVAFTRTLAGFNVWTVTTTDNPVGFVHVKADGSFTGFHAPLDKDDAKVAPIVSGPPSANAPALSAESE